MEHRLCKACVLHWYAEKKQKPQCIVALVRSRKTSAQQRLGGDAHEDDKQIGVKPLQPDEVRSKLKAYRENKSRIDYIALYAEQIKDGLRIENRPEMNAVHAQQYECSSGSFDSSPTERLALAEESAAGRRWREELEQLKRDERKARFDIAFVDTWLQALTDKERAAVTAHEIDGLPWFKVAFQSERLFGHYLTADSLRKIGKAAFDKICRIAR